MDTMVFGRGVPTRRHVSLPRTGTHTCEHVCDNNDDDRATFPRYGFDQQTSLTIDCWKEKGLNGL